MGVEVQGGAEMDLEKDFAEVVALVSKHPYIFGEDVNPREKYLWDEYVKEEGDVAKVSETVGISIHYVRRLLRKVYFIAYQYEGKHYEL